MNKTFNQVMPVALAIGSLAAAADALFACAFWGLEASIPPRVIFQSIAAGILGDLSFRGGMPTALLGAVLHVFIAVAMVATYLMAGLRFPALGTRPLRNGAIYGVLLYLSMQLIIVPISAAPEPIFNNHWWVTTSIIMHVVIGMLSAGALYLLMQQEGNL